MDEMVDVCKEGRKWYVLHVRTGEEIDIVWYLGRIMADDARAISPIREIKERRGGKWETVERKCFPGYVFVETEMTPDNYYKLISVPGVIRILGEDKPQDVPFEEMEIVLMLENDGVPFGMSDVCFFQNEVMVLSGPLRGFEDRIVSVDPRRFRAKVCIDVLGKSKFVEFSINLVGK